MRYRVQIRRGPWEVKPEAEQLDGKIYNFVDGWVMTSEDTSLYTGEKAMIPEDDKYPPDAPTWIARGDLIYIASLGEDL